MSYVDDILMKYYNDDNKYISETNHDTFDDSVEYLSEAEYNKSVKHLRLEVLDVEKFIKNNDLKEITNPTFYSRNNIPTDDGLLSNSIFGITTSDRSGIFAYIDLHGWYLDPSCYKNWCKIDSKIKDVVHKVKTFSVNINGDIVEDENGENGVEFLKKNIDKIKFKRSDSIGRNRRADYLDLNKKKMFISKYIVIPPYYRDTNTGKKTVGIEGINKLYAQLLTTIQSIDSTQEFGFDMTGPLGGKVQETLLAIYDVACANTNANVKDAGTGLGGKMGIIRSANKTKTSTYGARLVITAPNLKVNSPKDFMADFDKSSVPLAACITCFKPFVHFYVKRFFENEFLGTTQYPFISTAGEIIYAEPKDPLIEFSDERIDAEMDRFVHSYNNRFVPIEVPIVNNTGKPIWIMWKGKSKPDVNESLYRRRLTWCDIFFMACNDAVKDKMVLITRYPVDTKFNEITTKVLVSSTKVTEPMYIDGIFYKYYPKIKEEDIGTNTGNLFMDTMVMSNLYLPGCGGDYDGDTVSLKGVFTNEANDELRKFQNSKANFIDLGASNIRKSEHDCIQSIYVITKILDSDKSKITDPVF